MKCIKLCILFLKCSQCTKGLYHQSTIKNWKLNFLRKEHFNFCFLSYDIDDQSIILIENLEKSLLAWLTLQKCYLYNKVYQKRILIVIIKMNINIEKNTKIIKFIRIGTLHTGSKTAKIMHEIEKSWILINCKT